MKSTRVQTVLPSGHRLDHAQRPVYLIQLAKTRDERIVRALPSETLVEASECFCCELVEQYGKGGHVIVGDELEGVGGVEATVLHALVEEVAERVKVSVTAGGDDEVVVIGRCGYIRKWLRV